jgi:hypothetical protein
MNYWHFSLITTAFGLHHPKEAAGRVGAVDRHLNKADAPPQPRYRGLTLPKLRFGRVTLVVFSEKRRII